MADPRAILTLNAGSSSIKAALFAGAGLRPVFKAALTGIGEHPRFKAEAADGEVLADEQIATARRCSGFSSLPSTTWTAKRWLPWGTASSMADRGPDQHWSSRE